MSSFLNGLTAAQLRKKRLVELLNNVVLQWSRRYHYNFVESISKTHLIRVARKVCKMLGLEVAVDNYWYRRFRGTYFLGVKSCTKTIRGKSLDLEQIIRELDPNVTIYLTEKQAECKDEYDIDHPQFSGKYYVRKLSPKSNNKSSDTENLNTICSGNSKPDTNINCNIDEADITLGSCETLNGKQLINRFDIDKGYLLQPDLDDNAGKSKTIECPSKVAFGKTGTVETYPNFHKVFVVQNDRKVPSDSDVNKPTNKAVNIDNVGNNSINSTPDNSKKNYIDDFRNYLNDYNRPQPKSRDKSPIPSDKKHQSSHILSVDLNDISQHKSSIVTQTQNDPVLKLEPNEVNSTQSIYLTEQADSILNIESSVKDENKLEIDFSSLRPSNDNDDDQNQIEVNAVQHLPELEHTTNKSPITLDDIWSSGDSSTDIETWPQIVSYAQALSYLKPLEDFVLRMEVSSAIGLVSNLKHHFQECIGLKK